MADRWAFVVAIDKPLDPAIGTCPYAEAGAKRVIDALTAAGYPKDHQVVLLGPHATKAVIELRWRRLKKTILRGDEVLVYFASRGFPRDGRLACWDTLPDELTETSVAVAELAATLAPKAAQGVFLFDAAVGDLGPLFDESAQVVGLAAATDDTPHVATPLKASLWAHLVAEAIAGRATKATNADGTVTALSLHRFIEDNLPRLLRKHADAGASQQPLLFGEQNAAAVIADLSGRAHDTSAGFLLDPDRLRRVVFRADNTVRVKDLTAWRKTYDLPTTASPASRKFVARVANVDVKTDLDLVYEAIRQTVGSKRKDMVVETGPDGVGCVRTPDFEYTVTAALDPSDPTRVTWRREVGGFTDPAFVRGPELAAVFGQLFDALAFEFRSPIDVAALVDRLEDHPPKGAKLHVASDGVSCDVVLAGFAGRVTVARHSLTVHGRSGATGSLLDQLLAFLTTVGPLGEQAMLPPAS